jgi:hypothetical protein
MNHARSRDGYRPGWQGTEEQAHQGRPLADHSIGSALVIGSTKSSMIGAKVRSVSRLSTFSLRLAQPDGSLANRDGSHHG